MDDEKSKLDKPYKVRYRIGAESEDEEVQSAIQKDLEEGRAVVDHEYINLEEELRKRITQVESLRQRLAVATLRTGKHREELEPMARAFWERVYVAAIEIAQKQSCPQVPWSERNAEIADHALERWRERFDPKVSE